MLTLMVICHCPKSQKISEEIDHRAESDLAGCMVALQEMRAQNQPIKTIVRTRRIILRQSREDAISVKGPTSLDSKRSIMHLKSVRSVYTQMRRVKGAISLIVRMSRCQHSNLSSWTPQMKMTTNSRRWRKSAKTLPASLLRSWMSKLVKTFLAGSRCASECREQLALQIIISTSGST